MKTLLKYAVQLLLLLRLVTCPSHAAEILKEDLVVLLQDTPLYFDQTHVARMGVKGERYFVAAVDHAESRVFLKVRDDRGVATVLNVAMGAVKKLDKQPESLSAISGFTDKGRSFRNPRVVGLDRRGENVFLAHELFRGYEMISLVPKRVLPLGLLSADQTFPSSPTIMEADSGKKPWPPLHLPAHLDLPSINQNIPDKKWSFSKRVSNGMRIGPPLVKRTKKAASPEEEESFDCTIPFETASVIEGLGIAIGYRGVSPKTPVKIQIQLRPQPKEGIITFPRLDDGSMPYLERTVTLGPSMDEWWTAETSFTLHTPANSIEWTQKFILKLNFGAGEFEINRIMLLPVIRKTPVTK